MFSSVYGAALSGIYARVVRVEADASFGIPSACVVGIPGCEVKESLERVRAALKNSGYQLRQQKILINLSPAGIRKDGTGLDLPIAVGILLANELLKADRIPYLLFVGELSLSGHICPVNGVLNSVCAAREANCAVCIVPAENLAECADLKDIQVYGATTLREVCEFVNGRGKLLTLDELHQQETGTVRTKDLIKAQSTAHLIRPAGHGALNENSADFADVRGQVTAKRAALVAASGMHNIAFIGPPGSGKTMLACRLAGILPSLTYEESLELTKIYSAAGLISGVGLLKKRPFRAPGTKITLAAMLGGGADAKPGEVTLADQGVLFLDEMPEFDTKILEALRGPLQDHFVRVSSLKRSYTFPARLLLAAGMNLGKQAGDDGGDYLSRISLPLWDRFDIGVRLQAVSYESLQPGKEECGLGADRSFTTGRMREAAEAARERQLWRFRGTELHFNAQMSPRQIALYCRTDAAGERLLEHFYKEKDLSVRGYHGVLKTARTIADLNGCEKIREGHLVEAMHYRGCLKGEAEL